MPGEQGRGGRYLLSGLGMAALLALGVFYLASGLLAPGWAVVLLVAFWICLLALGVAWFRRHPVRVLALPLVAAGVWYGALTLGETLLGWTG